MFYTLARRYLHALQIIAFCLLSIDNMHGSSLVLVEIRSGEIEERIFGFFAVKNKAVLYLWRSQTLEEQQPI